MESFSHRMSRAFSVKDKNRDGALKNRSDISDFNGVFVLDDKAKKPSKDIVDKIHQLSEKLQMIGYANIPDARIEYILRAKNVDGDVDKAWQLWRIFDDAVAGTIRPFDPNVAILGAENRERVTCYIDALLFAMLVKADVFEALLYQEFQDEPRKKLVTLLRLWVNMLRAGKLITADITQKLQEILAECGYSDAGRIRQQDAQELFINITEILQMPLLTLKTDTFHSGEKDMDSDHRFITERLLNVAIPEESIKEGTVTLEKCLEEYFNNRVEVRRELKRRNTIQSQYSRHDSANTQDKQAGLHVETVEVTASSPSTPIERPKNPFIRPELRERATSIFSDRTFETTRPLKKRSNSQQLSRRRQGSVRKEVSMPAWQFLNLIPWYTDNSSDGDAQIASHFSKKRPMLGICLKRYDVRNGQTTRLNTHVDIPLEMRSPYFDCNDNPGKPDIPTSDFKLVLESVVCHKGTTPNAGHYIALARVRAGSQDRSETFSDVTGGQEYDTGSDMWIRHDDLGFERVKGVDINQALQDRSALPYLLFYRVRPIDDGASLNEELPPYEAFGESFASVDQKLAKYEAEARASQDASDHSSRRASRVVLSDTHRSRRSSMVEDGSQSAHTAGSATKSEQPATGQTTPLEESRNGDSKRQISRPDSRPKSARPSFELGDRTVGRMGKLSSRFSRDKLVDSGTITSNNEPKHEKRVEGSPKADGIKHNKSHQKLNRFMSTKHKHKRVVGKEPDRDCIMM